MFSPGHIKHMAGESGYTWQLKAAVESVIVFSQRTEKPPGLCSCTAQRGKTLSFIERRLSVLFLCLGKFPANE